MQELKHADDDESQFKTYLRGKIYVLQGVCLEKLGQIGKSIDLYYKACSTYNIKFPRSL